MKKLELLIQRNLIILKGKRPAVQLTVTYLSTDKDILGSILGSGVIFFSSRELFHDWMDWLFLFQCPLSMQCPGIVFGRGPYTLIYTGQGTPLPAVSFLLYVINRTIKIPWHYDKCYKRKKKQERNGNWRNIFICLIWNILLKFKFKFSIDTNTHTHSHMYIT